VPSVRHNGFDIHLPDVPPTLLKNFPTIATEIFRSEWCHYWTFGSRPREWFPREMVYERARPRQGAIKVKFKSALCNHLHHHELHHRCNVFLFLFLLSLLLLLPAGPLAAPFSSSSSSSPPSPPRCHPPAIFAFSFLFSDFSSRLRFEGGGRRRRSEDTRGPSARIRRDKPRRGGPRMHGHRGVGRWLAVRAPRRGSLSREPGFLAAASGGGPVCVGEGERRPPWGLEGHSATRQGEEERGNDGGAPARGRGREVTGWPWS